MLALQKGGKVSYKQTVGQTDRFSRFRVQGPTTPPTRQAVHTKPAGHTKPAALGSLDGALQRKFWSSNSRKEDRQNSKQEEATIRTQSPSLLSREELLKLGRL